MDERRRENIPPPLAAARGAVDAVGIFALGWVGMHIGAGAAVLLMDWLDRFEVVRKFNDVTLDNFYSWGFFVGALPMVCGGLIGAFGMVIAGAVLADHSHD